MKKRQIGSSELVVSEIGLGCMSLGTDKKKASEILSAALDGGINYLDTADLYDFGTNEEIVGSVLKGRRQEIILATKAGNRWNEAKDSWTWDASPAYLKQAVKNSLKRLQTDYIDLFQLHGGTMEDDHEAIIEAFEDLVKEGVIRYYGISSIRPNVIHSYLTKSNIVSVMMQYSLLDRRPEEYLPWFKENKVSVLARGPLAKGLLSDKMLEKAGKNILENGFMDYSFRELEELLGRLKECFSSRPMQETAFQYILSHPEVAAVTAGASSKEQILANMKAAQGSKLSPEELSFLKEVTKAGCYDQHRL